MVMYLNLVVLLAASLLSTATSTTLPRGENLERWNKAGSESVSTLSVTDTGSGTEIIIISANGGGSSATQYYNSMMMTAGTTHMVTVGGSAGLIYSPSSINASVGDIVQFNFESTNHTVTQSSFAAPCVKMAGGVDSGFMPNVNNTLSPAPTLQFQVTTSTPIWMYCAQKGHCGKGMVFAINPTASKSFEAFQAAAIAQNGTGTGAAAAAAGSSSASASVSVVASSSTAAVAAQSTGAVASGTGTLSTGGACACSCLCGAEAFPAGAGVGAMGGWGGQLAMTSAAAVKKR